MTSLRLSVTDRCDLRCRYCLPEEGTTPQPRSEILSFEEIIRLVRILAGRGIDRVRVTGGEPLLRKDLPLLLGALSALEGIRDLSLTTNGTLLAEKALALKTYGLNRLTISLDTLKADRYRALTRGGDIRDVFRGIQRAREAGLNSLKINMVVLRGVNEEEVADLAEFAFSVGALPRFLEVMPLGAVGFENQQQFVPASEIRSILGRRFALEECGRPGSSTARIYQVKGSTLRMGIISPVSDRFCASCDRLRLTASGKLQLCLSHEAGVDLRGAIREGRDDDFITRLIQSAVFRKPEGNGFKGSREPVYQISMSGIGG